MASADLHGLRIFAADVWTLWQKHPILQPFGLALQKSLVRRWGGWPLDKKVWTRLGITRGSGGVVYQRADRVTVLAFHTKDLPRLLGTITQAVRRLGARTIAPLRRSEVRGSQLWTVDGTWSCGHRRKVVLCADVAPGSWSRVVKSTDRTLWQGPLGRVPQTYLQGPLGAWVSASPTVGRSLVSLGARVTGWRAKGFWTAVTPGRRLRLGVFAVRDGDRRVSSGKTRLPAPGQSGLATGLQAQLVLRLRLAPAQLATLLERLLPEARHAVALMSHRAWNGKPLAEEILDGEVVLLSSHGGLAAILGVRSRSRALRGMKTLSLLLAPRISHWQKRVRELGGGWDLAHSRSNIGDIPGHRLTLTLPKGARSPLPLLGDGRLDLLWGVARRHLVVATDPHLFRQVVARVEQPDTALLGTLPGADARSAFDRHRTAALLLRPDDPISSQPARQRAVFGALLDRVPARQRPWVALARMVMDLTATLVVAWDDLPGGLGCLGVLDLVSEPGSGMRIPPRYLATLAKKWGGNRDGFLSALRQISATQTASVQRAKARRQLALRKAVLCRGAVGLAASVLIPWLQRRQRAAATQRAERNLDRLVRALEEQARKARKRTPLERRRWHRPLCSTPPTPVRSCCSATSRACQSQAADWSHATWQRLGFKLEGPHRYRYQLTVQRTTTQIRVTLRALGDLDCNGRVGILERSGTIDTATGKLRFDGTTRRRRND